MRKGKKKNRFVRSSKCAPAGKVMREILHREKFDRWLRLHERDATNLASVCKYYENIVFEHLKPPGI